jgi:undecaprenyl-diphosphatase
VSAVIAEGPVSRSLERRFASAPRIVPLVTIVVVGYVAMVAVLIGVGELIVHAGALGGLRQWDDDVTSWMVDHRTAFLDGLTGFLTRIADTMGVVLIALVVEIVLVVQRRWWALLIVPIGLGLELLTFLTVNSIVGRPRPDVPKLGSEPSTSSFPSGHIAATVVLWGAIALLFCSASTYRWVRATAYTIVVVLACAVGTARVYRGMHHPIDVLFGGLMGVGALAIAVLAVRVASDDERSHRDDADDDHAMEHPDQLPAVSA